MTFVFVYSCHFQVPMLWILQQNIYCKQLPVILASISKASLRPTVIRMHFLCLRTGCVCVCVIVIFRCVHTVWKRICRCPSSMSECVAVCRHVCVVSGVKCVSSWAEMSHLSWWERCRPVSEPGPLQRLLLIRKVGRSCTFSSRPRPQSALNEFILLCGQQRRAPHWEKVPEQLTVQLCFELHSAITKTFESSFITVT